MFYDQNLDTAIHSVKYLMAAPKNNLSFVDCNPVFPYANRSSQCRKLHNITNSVIIFDPDLDKKLRDWMCQNFYDIRTFGAVMTTFTKNALNCGQVRGPVQLGIAQSVEPVVPQEVTITRVAITTETDAERKGTEMGRKYIVPYGLYRCEGYVSANLARKTTGFSEEDLALLWEAVLNMFEHDHSAARGKMAVRELIVFKHDSELGCASAWKLFESVHVQRRDADDTAPARAYQDYTVTVDEAAIPAGVTCMRMG